MTESTSIDTPDFAVEFLHRAGYTDAEAAQVLAAHREAQERYSSEDDEVRLLRRAALTIRLEGRAARDWQQRESAGGTVICDNERTGRRVLLSVLRESDGEVWLHGSISRKDRGMPSYDDMCLLHRLFMGRRLAYELFLPEDEHFNDRHGLEVRHLFAPLTGSRRTPDFRSKAGTI